MVISFADFSPKFFGQLLVGTNWHSCLRPLQCSIISADHSQQVPWRQGSSTKSVWTQIKTSSVNGVFLGISHTQNSDHARYGGLGSPPNPCWPIQWLLQCWFSMNCGSAITTELRKGMEIGGVKMPLCLLFPPKFSCISQINYPESVEGLWLIFRVLRQLMSMTSVSVLIALKGESFQRPALHRLGRAFITLTLHPLSPSPLCPLKPVTKQDHKHSNRAFLRVKWFATCK